MRTKHVCGSLPEIFKITANTTCIISKLVGDRDSNPRNPCRLSRPAHSRVVDLKSIAHRQADSNIGFDLRLPGSRPGTLLINEKGVFWPLVPRTSVL